ncbi:hypothetical protein [Costertonia aggregata]|uniref:Outer membrane beta-barrel protein n=1 Tax=Costertonia aggregata TaxID=343403 RepID=A0A7H9ATB0_9FLAO|nr:hypothetical protein [Costertonia aggregata]QLG46435.1 hypothetical protein HYG79_14115 [Costertonia aggregata]
MKKVILVAALALFGYGVNAQDGGGQTDQGSWLIEANTNFGAAAGGNTAFQFITVDGNTLWNIGFEGGYFVAENLAIKAGLGYGDGDGVEGTFGYKIGGKYYINGQIPVALDLNGSSSDGTNAMFVGLQAGYAIFLGDNVSIEPGLRYDYGLNEGAGDGDFNPLSLNVGFALHF